MGLDGAGIATLSARIVAAATIIVYALISPSLKRGLPVAWTGKGLTAEVRKLLAIGLPSGGTHLAEISGFAFGSLMMGWLGASALAAHQIAITCAATTFMIPLGLSQAATVRVGVAHGKGDYHGLTRAAIAVTIVSCSISIIGSVLFATMPEFFASWFLDVKSLEAPQVLA